MKKLVYIIILSFIIKPVFPLIDYAINYDYITTVLCENKDKPKLQCNGKCHLMKNLEKNSDSNSSQPSEKKANPLEKEVMFYEKICRYCNLSLIVEEVPEMNLNYQNLYAYLKPNFLFRPPAMLS